MGNAGSSTVHMHRERHKSTDLSTPSSPAHFRDSVGSGAAGGGSGGAAALGGIGASGGGGGGGSGGQAFSFDKKHTAVLTEGSSQEDEDPYYTRAAAGAGAKRTSVLDNESTTTTATTTSAAATAERENTMDENNDEEQQLAGSQDLDAEPKKTALPTVLRWDYGGKNVTISGTFSKWKPIPMVRSHGNFVTIIDLAEGDHQYKFCVDGEWKHDPKLVRFPNKYFLKFHLKWGKSIREHYLQLLMTQ